jgi:hypothetical protein
VIAGHRAGRVALRLLAVGSALLALTPTAASLAGELDAAALCVDITHHQGARYALAYAGGQCAGERLAVPRDLYDALATWSTNAEHAGILAPLEAFRIRARLATRDERSRPGRSGIHAGSSDYKWAEHAQFAYLTAIGVLGRASAIAQSLEQSLLGRRFATRRDDRLVFEQRKLSAADTVALRSVLATAEAALGMEDDMRAAHRTLDEAARAVSGYERARRRSLAIFRLD